MKQILKRLELIKTSISIDEQEIIELQIMKLEKLNIDDDVKNILQKLENLDYGTVLSDIENYISKYTGMVEYVDTEIQGLKLELKSLENKLENLSLLKAEYLNDIEEFNTLYSIKLGDIIQSILKLKKQILESDLKEQEEQRTKDKEVYDDTINTVDEIKETIEEFENILQSIDEDDENYQEINTAYKELQEELKTLEEDLFLQKEKLEDNDIFEEYEEAQANYEEFSDEYKDIKESLEDTFTLGIDEKKELKKLWKKASKLCHPDIVNDELKEQAHTIMQSLNDAYSKKDIQQVRKILTSLEKGIGFKVSSDSINDKELFKSKIEEFREDIQNMENSIDGIKKDDTFVVIQDIDDMDEYFEELKSELENEYITLKEWMNAKTKKNEEASEHLNVPKISKVELESKIVLWIIQEIENENNKDFDIDIKSSLRIKDDARRIAEELMETGVSNIHLAFISGLHHFTRDEIFMSTFTDLEVEEQINDGLYN